MGYITFTDCSSVYRRYILFIIYAISCLVNVVHLHDLPWWNHDKTVTKNGGRYESVPKVTTPII